MKNILIIGGSSGIGEELAKQMSLHSRVYSTFYRKNEPLEKNEQLSYRYCNVMDKEQDFSYLPEQLHGLAYCPGSINLKPFSRITPEEFVSDFQLNVTGALKVIQQIFPRLKAARNASIVLFSTVAVQQGFSFHSLVASSKGAIEGLTKALAAEFAPAIRVNCIAPSITETPLSQAFLNNDAKKDASGLRHPLKRIGQPEDIASMAAFLLSDNAGWITGQIFAVDGGMSTIKI